MLAKNYRKEAIHLTVSVNVFCAVPLSESVTWKIRSVLPAGSELAVRAPVAGSILRSPGIVPPTIDHAYGLFPPIAPRRAPYGLPDRPSGSFLVATLTGLTTDTLSRLIAVAPSCSVTRKVIR